MISISLIMPPSLCEAASHEAHLSKADKKVAKLQNKQLAEEAKQAEKSAKQSTKVLAKASKLTDKQAKAQVKIDAKAAKKSSKDLAKANKLSEKQAKAQAKTDAKSAKKSTKELAKADKQANKKAAIAQKQLKKNNKIALKKIKSGKIEPKIAATEPLLPIAEAPIQLSTVAEQPSKPVAAAPLTPTQLVSGELKKAQDAWLEGLAKAQLVKAGITSPKAAEKLALALKAPPQTYNLMANGLQEPEDAPAIPQLDKLHKANSTTPSADVNVLKSGIAANANEVDVTVNKAVILNLSRPASRVSISDPTIASAVVISPTQIQLIGNQVGVVNLLIWGDASQPEHTILDINVHRDVSVLVRQLQYVDSGIRIVPLAAEDTVILTGQASTREAAQLAVELAKAFFKSASAGGGATGSTQGPNSQSPGSAIPGSTPNVINLISVKGEPSTKVDLARQKLIDIHPGVRLDIVPGPDGSEKAMLTGRVKTASAITKAINTTAVFYGTPGVKILSGPGGNSIRAGAGDNSFPSGEGFTTNNDINVLQGAIMTDQTGNVISMIEVANKPQIKCSIQFIEVAKTNLDALGHAFFGAGGSYGIASVSGVQSPASGKTVSTVDTDDSGAAYSSSSTHRGTSPTSALGFVTGFSHTFQDGITQVLSINEQFAAALSALEERRKAKTVAQPTLTMMSGEKASFLAGGEVPIPVVGGNGQVDISYHEFGVRLNLIATYTDSGKIHMVVSPEISSVDPTNGVTTSTVVVPGFTTRRMQTTLEVENGQSFVIAGLFNETKVWSTSAFPWLGRLPVIGSFLRNKWKTGNSSEMVVIIKPEVMMIDNSAPTAAAAVAEPAVQSVFPVK